MKIEDELKLIIKAKDGSVLAFSKKAGIPYGTLAAALDRGIESMTLKNAKLVCKELDISLDALVEGIIKSRKADDHSTIFVERHSAESVGKDAERLAKRLRAFEEALSVLAEKKD